MQSGVSQLESGVLPSTPRVVSGPRKPRMTWWVLWTGFADAAWNMATDEWLLNTSPERPPTLRLYGWSHPTVSLGRNECWRKAVRRERLGPAGVRLVRRPTGGRAVFHHR